MGRKSLLTKILERKVEPPPSLEERMIRLLRSFYIGGTCARASSRPWKGETCAESQSRIQGVPCIACDWCETEALLKEIGQLPERR